MSFKQPLLRFGALVSLCSSVALAIDVYSPKYFHLGAGPTIDGLQAYHGKSITLDESNSVLTLDYASEVGGWPWVEFENPSSPVQIQLKYSEPYDGLAQAQGDGPW